MATRSELADYISQPIRVLNFIQHVRMRPGMFFGELGSRGLHFLLSELQYCNLPPGRSAAPTTWLMELLGRGACRFTIRGFSGLHEIPPETILNLLERGEVLAGYGLHGGHPVFLANPVCLDFSLSITRNGQTWSQEFSRGYPISSMTVASTSAEDGIALGLQIDWDVFDVGADFEYDRLFERFRELAYLHQGMTLRIVDRRCQPVQEATFAASGGLGEYVSFLNRDRRPLHSGIIILDGVDGELSFRAAMQWTHSDEVCVRSYANSGLIEGTHTNVWQQAITRSIQKYGKEYGILRKERLSWQQCSKGLTAVLVVDLPEPRFDTALRTRLFNPELEPLIASTMNQWFAAFLETDESSARAIIQRALAAYRTDEAAKKVRRQQRVPRNRREQP